MAGRRVSNRSLYIDLWWKMNDSCWEAFRTASFVRGIILQDTQGGLHVCCLSANGWSVDICFRGKNLTTCVEMTQVLKE